jgi:hypothetical protein
VGKLLRAIGVVLTLASIAAGIWLQTNVGSAYPGSLATSERLTYALFTLTPLAVGCLLVAVGHALAIYESRADQQVLDVARGVVETFRPDTLPT